MRDRNLKRIEDIELEVALVEDTPYFDQLIEEWPYRSPSDPEQAKKTVATHTSRAAMSKVQAALDNNGLAIVDPEQHARDSVQDFAERTGIIPMPLPSDPNDDFFNNQPDAQVVGYDYIPAPAYHSTDPDTGPYPQLSQSALDDEATNTIPAVVLDGPDTTKLPEEDDE